MNLTLDRDRLAANWPRSTVEMIAVVVMLLLAVFVLDRAMTQVAFVLTAGVVAARLVRDADRLRHLALTDDLTGLHNLRSFEAHLSVLVRDSRATFTPLAVLVMDVDRLKALNDRYGHLTGAEAVRTVGQIIAARIPEAAVGCRYGGDEFAIAIPRCTEVRGSRLGDDLCRSVRGVAPVLAGRAFPAGTLSISIGGACAVPSTADDHDAGEELFQAADLALYQVKATGRGSCWVRQWSVPSPQTRSTA